MEDLPEKPYDDWTLADVEAFTEGEIEKVMPGSGRKVPGPRRKLLVAMQDAGVERVADLESLIRDRHRFSLLMMREKW